MPSRRFDIRPPVPTRRLNRVKPASSPSAKGGPADPGPPPPGPPRPLLAGGLQPVIDAVTGGNQRRFARFLGTNDRTVRRWLAAPPHDVPRHIQVLGAALLALSPEALRTLVRAIEGEGPPAG